MSAVGGAIAGALGLIVLEGAVKNPGNAGAGLGALNGLASRFLDPSVPAIPNLAKRSPSGPAGAQVGVSPGGVQVGPLPNDRLLPAGRQKKVNVEAATTGGQMTYPASPAGGPATVLA